VPFETGSFLGQMKREYADYEIEAFYSGGLVKLPITTTPFANIRCKQYGLQLRERGTNKVEHVLKCRGLTLDSTNEDRFNFDRFKVGVSKTHNVVDEGHGQQLWWR
jgi:hypothetical protein